MQSNAYLCSRLHIGPICSRLHKYAFDCILLGVNYLTLSWTVKRSFGVNEKDFFHHYVFLRMVRSFWIFPFGAARCAIANWLKRSFGVKEKDFIRHYLFLRMVRSFWIFPFGAARCAIANCELRARQIWRSIWREMKCSRKMQPPVARATKCSCTLRLHLRKYLFKTLLRKMQPLYAAARDNQS